jgi:hypothetical protein
VQDREKWSDLLMETLGELWKPEKEEEEDLFI